VQYGLKYADAPGLLLFDDKKTMFWEKHGFFKEKGLK